MLVFDDDGNEIGDVALSENVAALLERDAEVTVHFHTPRMMVYELGAHNFTFTLRKLGARATSHDGGCCAATSACNATSARSWRGNASPASPG